MGGVGNSQTTSKSADFVLGTAGHIDHGKTALVRALTGVDTDRLPAEKARGITIDLGFAALDVGKHRISIVDVPGHERFIRNMLAGATGLDFALLILAADDSVMPQTREHLEILKWLGLRGGVIALTKADLVGPDWLSLVTEEVQALVRGSFLESAPIVATSSVTGLGIAELKLALAELCQKAGPAQESGHFRMAIDRSFTLSGHGTVVTGTVASGKVAIGDELELWTDGKRVRVRSLHRHDKSVDSIGRGSRAAINLVGVHHTEVNRGDVLAFPGYLTPSKRLSIEIGASADAVRPIRPRARYRIYLGTAEVSGRVVFLEPEKNDNHLKLAQLILSEPVVAVHGQPFVIREESPPATIGGGRVLQPSPRRIRRRDLAAIECLGRLRASAFSETTLAAALEDLGLNEWTLASLSRDSGLSKEEIPSALARLEASGHLVEVPLGPRRTAKVSQSKIQAIEDRVVRVLKRLHSASPRLSAIPKASLMTAVADIGNETLVLSLIDGLHQRKLLLAEGRMVSIRGYEPKLSHAERRLKEEIAEGFRGTGFTPPDPDQWTKRPGLKPAMVLELFALLRDEECLAEIGGGFFLDAEAVVELRRIVTSKLSDGSGMSMADLRDALGTTRKFAVPIGEYLDRIGLTVRQGDVRRLKPPSEPLA